MIDQELKSSSNSSKFIGLGGVLFVLGVLLFGGKLIDLVRYPDVPLNLQPKSFHEGSRLFKTIARVADCDYNEIGVFVSNIGVQHTYCDKDLKIDGVDIRLSATIDVFFEKDKLDQAIAIKKSNNTLILSGNYYLITAIYHEEGVERKQVLLDGVVPTHKVVEERYLEDFPREFVFIEQGGADADGADGHLVAR